jgi:hypothetical protein
MKRPTPNIPQVDIEIPLDLMHLIYLFVYTQKSPVWEANSCLSLEENLLRG